MDASDRIHVERTRVNETLPIGLDIRLVGDGLLEFADSLVCRDIDLELQLARPCGR